MNPTPLGPIFPVAVNLSLKESNETVSDGLNKVVTVISDIGVSSSSSSKAFNEWEFKVEKIIPIIIERRNIDLFSLNNELNKKPLYWHHDRKFNPKIIAPILSHTQILFVSHNLNLLCETMQKLPLESE
jgi:hypothetical protein